MLTWQWLDRESMHVHCTALPESRVELWERWHHSCVVLCSLVKHSSFLSSAAKSFQLMKEIVSVVSMSSHELLMNHRRLALEGKIRAICALFSVLQDVLRDVLWDLIHEDERWFSWLLQWRSSDAHRFEKYSAWIERQRIKERKQKLLRAEQFLRIVCSQEKAHEASEK